MTLLTGKNVIITGASRGIGLAIAHAFAAQRAKSILLIGRDPGRLSKVRKEILSKNKSSIRIRPGNVADRECWKVVVKEMVCPPCFEQRDIRKGQWLNVDDVERCRYPS
jgi:short-subunit dehydrogenase